MPPAQHGSNASDPSDKDIEEGRGMQDLMHDHITITGRLMSFANCLIIALYIGALSTQEWSITDRLGNPNAEENSKKFDSTVTEGTFGLQMYCVKVPIKAWSNDLHPVCHEYSDKVKACTDPLNISTCVELKGETRFAEFYEESEAVTIVLAMAIAIAVIGSAFSERIYVLLLSQTLNGVLGMVAVIKWHVAEGAISDVSAGELRPGYSAILAIVAIVVSFVCVIAGAIDALHTKGKHCCRTVDTAPHSATVDIQHDGIQLTTGRLAALLVTVVWVLFIIKTADPDWSETDNLGNEGSFCIPEPQATVADRELCQNRYAKFGLWVYCLEERVAYFGGDLPSEPTKSLVCLDWSTSVTVTGQNAENGTSRFNSHFRDIVAATMIISVLVAAVSDVFSEKLALGFILCFLAFITGLVSFAAWISFQEQLGLSLMFQGALLLLPWLLAAAASFLYLHNYDYWRRTYAKKSGILCEMCYTCTMPLQDAPRVDLEQDSPEPSRQGDVEVRVNGVLIQVNSGSVNV